MPDGEGAFYGTRRCDRPRTDVELLPGRTEVCMNGVKVLFLHRTLQCRCVGKEVIQDVFPPGGVCEEKATPSKGGKDRFGDAVGVALLVSGRLKTPAVGSKSFNPV